MAVVAAVKRKSLSMCPKIDCAVSNFSLNLNGSALVFSVRAATGQPERR